MAEEIKFKIASRINKDGKSDNIPEWEMIFTIEDNRIKQKRFEPIEFTMYSLPIGNIFMSIDYPFVTDYIKNSLSNADIKITDPYLTKEQLISYINSELLNLAHNQSLIVQYELEFYCNGNYGDISTLTDKQISVMQHIIDNKGLDMEINCFDPNGNICDFDLYENYDDEPEEFEEKYADGDSSFAPFLEFEFEFFNDIVGDYIEELTGKRRVSVFSYDDQVVIHNMIDESVDVFIEVKETLDIDPVTKFIFDHIDWKFMDYITLN